MLGHYVRNVFRLQLSSDVIVDFCRFEIRTMWNCLWLCSPVVIFSSWLSSMLNSVIAIFQMRPSAQVSRIAARRIVARVKAHRGGVNSIENEKGNSVRSFVGQPNANETVALCIFTAPPNPTASERCVMWVNWAKRIYSHPKPNDFLLGEFYEGLPFRHKKDARRSKRACVSSPSRANWKVADSCSTGVRTVSGSRKEAI